ncbi:MAG TPA: DUF4019 domain-containing protein [Candidatus Melainabacteria bacterium]|nr:DUF4019 domain-containing protein [Candidatus Melainabacteria bacterium]
MKILRNCTLLSITSFLFMAGAAPQAGAAGGADTADETAAEKAALPWLALVDQAKYSQSWAEASDYFKSMLSKAQWEKQVKAARAPMGKLISRAVKSKQFSKSLPGAPDGEYVVIQFETRFEGKSQAIETITPQKEKDGNWRVCGYYIR